jgi:hypothetical protein
MGCIPQECRERTATRAAERAAAAAATKWPGCRNTTIEDAISGSRASSDVDQQARPHAAASAATTHTQREPGACRGAAAGGATKATHRVNKVARGDLARARHCTATQAAAVRNRSPQPKKATGQGRTTAKELHAKRARNTTEARAKRHAEGSADVP